MPAGLQHLQATVVSAGHDGHRSRQVANPPRDQAQFPTPGAAFTLAEGGLRGGAHISSVPRALYVRQKGIAASVTGGAVAAPVAAETEMTKPAAQKMLGHHSRDGLIVHPDIGERKARQLRAKVDDRHLEFGERRGHPPICDASKDTITLPPPKPGVRHVAQAVRATVRQPLLMLLIVSGDASQKAPAELA